MHACRQNSCKGPVESSTGASPPFDSRCATRAGSSATRPLKPTRALEAAIVLTKAELVELEIEDFFFASLWPHNISYTYPILSIFIYLITITHTRRQIYIYIYVSTFI